MPDSEEQETSSAPTKFALWLDSIVPAVIPTDAEFARRIGVNQSYVHRWRRGRRPQVPALIRIADVTGTDIETLLRIVGYAPDDRDSSQNGKS